jgi:cytochrome c556
MRAFRRIPQGVVVGALSVLTIIGVAGAQSMPKVGSGDVIADRRRLMKLNAASLKDVNEKLKAGNIEAIAVNAETLALNAEHIPFLFPPNSLSDESHAKPEIWQRWDEFQKDAKNLETWSVKLRDTAASKDAAATEAVVKEFGRQTCGTCHTTFRKPLQP